MEISKKDWSLIILGLRKKLNLSHNNLGKLLNIRRKSIGRYEEGSRIPSDNFKLKILNFISEQKIELDKLKKLGIKYYYEIKKREKLKPLKLEYSKELAELIGILLGDGEIKKDGTLRIAFDPKKDKNFLYRKVFPLIKNILNNKIGFESEKRIAFYNIAFVRYLKEDCNLNPGSKFENNWEIPKWCFNKEEYLTSVLRGLFDTDGYFGYLKGSLELMFGRFSSKSSLLVKSIKNSLDSLKINHQISICNDGRYKIRIENKKYIIDFFYKIGTSNIKHIVRFLLWRIKKYESKIEKEGLIKLINKINKEIGWDIQKANLPFLWITKNRLFSEYIKEDLEYLEAFNIRKQYKWNKVSEELINLYGAETLAEELGIRARSIRKWRQGTRTPSVKFINKLIKIANKSDLDIEKYKVYHG